MLRRLAQQWMILSVIEWPFHTLRAISAVDGLLVYSSEFFYPTVYCRHL